jgi:phosphoesterase RecJ-like protein
MIFKNKISELRKIIKSNTSFFLTLHINPDADSCGSMLSFYYYLKLLKKKVYLYSKDIIQDNLKILPYVEHIKNEIKDEFFDVGVFFECSTPERAGEIIKKISFKKIISIDHHKTATRYGDINIYDTKASSTAEIMYDIFNLLGAKIDKTIAFLLYSGIVTDTNKFHYSQTSPKTHMIAAKLISTGINFKAINDNFFMKARYENIKLLGRGIEGMQIYDGSIALMQLLKKDFDEFKAQQSDTENIINYPMMIDNIKVSILIKEDEEKYTVTFRSKDEIDISKIALIFGGGGHKNASGFKISKSKMDLETLKKNIIDEVRKII